MAEVHRLQLIKGYFRLGLKYKDIQRILFDDHGIILCVRQLKRILHRENLYRYKNGADIITVVDFIMNKQRGSGALHGYRWMYQKMKCRGIIARKEDVRLLLKILDPEGTELRQKHKLTRRLYHSKGPHYIWHFDSYDKLRPYGICINGCIDGYSRKMLWLNAFHTSSDPRVIGGYYLEAVEKIGGCPVIVRGDKGTENTHVCAFQRFLRRNGNDVYHGERSFMYGRSTSNKRIESLWGFLRKECTEYWLSLFDLIKADGHFDGGYLDKHVVLFCFLPLIQDELDSTAEVWNCHVICPTSNPNVPSGRPNVMYSVPGLYAVDDYLCDVSDADTNVCKDNVVFRGGISCDEDIYNMCIHLMSENNLTFANDAYQAMDLYLDLRRLLQASILLL